MVLQLSKSLQVSQDLEEFKQSLDSKEQILDKAMVDLQKEKLEFEHEKLLHKQTNMQGKQGHDSDNCNMPDPKKDTCSIGSIPNHPLNENKIIMVAKLINVLDVYFPIFLIKFMRKSM